MSLWSQPRLHLQISRCNTCSVTSLLDEIIINEDYIDNLRFDPMNFFYMHFPPFIYQRRADTMGINFEIVENLVLYCLFVILSFQINLACWFLLFILYREIHPLFMGWEFIQVAVQSESKSPVTFVVVDNLLLLQRRLLCDNGDEKRI